MNYQKCSFKCETAALITTLKKISLIINLKEATKKLCKIIYLKVFASIISHQPQFDDILFFMIYSLKRTL